MQIRHQNTNDESQLCRGPVKVFAFFHTLRSCVLTRVKRHRALHRFPGKPSSSTSPTSLQPTQRPKLCLAKREGQKDLMGSWANRTPVTGARGQHSATEPRNLQGFGHWVIRTPDSCATSRCFAAETKRPWSRRKGTESRGPARNRTWVASSQTTYRATGSLGRPVLSPERWDA